jgi:hypothetical protein
VTVAYHKTRNPPAQAFPHGLARTQPTQRVELA